MFAEAHVFKPSEWIFMNCDLAKPCFAAFFDALEAIDRPVSMLAFKKCTFSEDGFRSIFQSIFFNECFHSLKDFTIEDTPLGPLSQCVLELTCCGWAMQSRCLRIVTLANCEIDGSEFISAFLKFDIGLERLILTGSELSRPLPSIQKVALKELTFLGLAKCQNVSLGFLSSLLDLIDAHSIALFGLDISDAQLSVDDLTTFLKMLASHNLSHLNTLIFDDNRMNSSQLHTFVDFLKRQSDLTTLSLNSVIDITDSPTGLRALLSTIRERPLRALSLQSDGSMPLSFGTLLTPLLRDPSILGLDHLDLTHQRIGSVGIDLLAAILEHGELVELLFDGSGDPSFDHLARFCEAVLSSRVRFASFPAADFDNIFRLIPLTEDANALGQRREELRRRFAAAYSAPLGRAERLRQFPASTSRRRGGAAAADPPRERLRTGSDGGARLPVGLEEARWASDRQAALLAEAVDLNDGDDPVWALLNGLHERLALAAILTRPPWDAALP
jgi:hypothetical protein